MKSGSDTFSHLFVSANDYQNMDRLASSQGFINWK